MNSNLSREEFVSNYFDNLLSDIERLDFENKLLHDPELREEYNFQKELVNGIKEMRRLELKSRLSNIPVSTPIYQTLGFKAIAIASITTGMGIGAYYLFNEKDDSQLLEVDLQNNKTVLFEENNVPEVPKSITPIDEKAKEDKNTSIVAQSKPKSEAIAKNIEDKVEPKVVQPNVIQPTIVEPFEDEDLETNDIGIENQVNSFDKVKENMESTVEIATVKDKRNKFHYKFFENKLYLLGNFNNMPYEIIELNSSKGKSYFLYYDNNFYRLNTEQLKPTPLVKIENDSLVNELRIIQLNHNN